MCNLMSKLLEEERRLESKLEGAKEVNEIKTFIAQNRKIILKVEILKKDALNQFAMQN